MCFVNDERVIGFEQRIGLRFGQQNTVGHQLDRSVFAQAVLKPHFVAHHLAQWRVEFLRNAFGHRARRNASRLRVANDLSARPFVRLPLCGTLSA